MDQVEMVRALVRDEGRLRETLQVHQERLFDVETATALRDRLDDTLDSVQRLVDDDLLWHELDLGAQALGQRTELPELVDLAWVSLPPVLEAFGYRSPPPPPASQLVDETVAAMAAAFEAGPEERRERIARARQRLVMLRMRVLRQVSEEIPDEVKPSALRRAGDMAARTTRTFLPVALGGAAGLAVESFVPATGTGMVVGKWMAKLAEKGLEIGASAAIGASGDGDEPMHHHLGRLPSPYWSDVPFDPVRVHRGALADALVLARNAAHARSADELRWQLSRSRRHLERVLEIDENDGEGCSVRSELERSLGQVEALVQGVRPCWSDAERALEQMLENVDAR